MKSRYIAVIPARGGSKRIPHKNIVPLQGKPLIEYTISAARNAAALSRIIVSTDDEEIARVAEGAGAEVLYPRPPELSTDTSDTLDVIRNVVSTLGQQDEYDDIIVLLQPTSPFRTGEHIDRAVALFRSSGADTVTAVRPVTDHPYWLWRVRKGFLTPFKTMKHIQTGRHSLPADYIENGSLYIFRRSLLDQGTLYGSRIVPFEMDTVDSVDIDEPLDLMWAEFLLGRGLVLTG